MKKVRLIASMAAATDPRTCGLCGAMEKLSRAHVPPQSAGNDHTVQRAPDRLVDGERGPGRWTNGGLWVRGLCPKCNSRCGGVYDKAYADFQRQIKRATTATARQLAVIPGEAPNVRFAPGAVARCVLYGMFAINPGLRVRYPALAQQLAEEDYYRGDKIEWPSGLGLKLGLSDPRRPHSALIAGNVWTFHAERPRLSHISLADIVWPPLSWSMVWNDHAVRDATGTRQITEGLADVSDWLHFGPHRTSVDLRNLGLTLQPWTHPLLSASDAWVELYSGEESQHPSVTVFGHIPQ